MKRLFILSTTLLLFISCGPSTADAQKEFKTLKKEVLHGHDVVMKDMMEINALLKQLNSKVDTTTTENKYKQAADSLKQAHDAMMTWMHDFHEAFPDLNAKDKSYTNKEYKARITRMKKQQEALKEVKTAMESSIINAKKMLGEK